MRRLYRSGAALALTLALGACGDGHAPADVKAVAATGERLSVKAATVADLKPVAAVVTTRNMGEARARIGGVLVKLNVREGDMVRQGQVLAVVADQRLAHETAAYSAQAAAAEAESVRAQADLARYRTLYDKGFYSKAGLDQVEAAARAAQGSAAAARAQRAASAELNAQGAILAPSAGRVLHAQVPAGSVVVAGQTVVTVTAGQPLLRVELPEAHARALKVGDAVALDPRDLPGAPATGTIAQLYPAVSAGRVTADITVPGLAADLVGQRARVRIKVGERQAIVVPRRFIATRFGVDYARLVDRDGQAVEVAVQIAPGPTAQDVEVLSGLAQGDVIVAARAAQ
ncbi:MAG: efflux RND transporter periplasmic adaptor subunit [Phenylobacterium sp.]|uniref:efflux RND transporter periplasmic adaptor subunit n=1 Tax=Phenylobacterium sp. TaxID=1871053 RepID=UPI00391998BE